MTKRQIGLYLIIVAASSVSGCKVIERARQFRIPFEIPNGIERRITEQKTIEISCENEDIKTYEKDGWKIIDTKESEVTCTWKTKRSKPGCNLKSDKGCRITVPDKKGIKKEYILERQTINPKK